MTLRHYLAGVALCALAACATLTPERRPAFDLLGRVAVAYDEGAFSSNIRWRHDARDEIWLMTPLGQTLAHIVDEPNGATLTAADQRQYRAFSVEQLTRQALGWELPLAQLQYWIDGLPAPGLPVTRRVADDGGRTSILEQHGWRIDYAYAADGGQPRRLEMRKGSAEIRVVVDERRAVE